LPMLDQFCLYGKSSTSPFRKMGHLTVAADTVEAAVDLGHRVKWILRVVSAVNQCDYINVFLKSLRKILFLLTQAWFVYY
jgi:hypothetical protein